MREEKNERFKLHCINQKEIFHVHTWRCGHAGEEREEAYVKSNPAWSKVTFTDHALFPGDLFLVPHEDGTACGL